MSSERQGSIEPMKMAHARALAEAEEAFDGR